MYKNITIIDIKPINEYFIKVLPNIYQNDEMY